jgi:hypothetical protein
MYPTALVNNECSLSILYYAISVYLCNYVIYCLLYDLYINYVLYQIYRSSILDLAELLYCLDRFYNWY